MEPSNSTGAFYTTRGVAKLLQVSVKTAQLWVESGALQAWKTPSGRRRITHTSVRELIAQREHAMLAGPQSESAALARTPQLLIVEDDKRIRRLYELTLSHWGLPMQLIMARDGFDALLKIGECQPDILITDLNMPGMDGYRLIAALSNDDRFRSTQLVVISSMSPTEARAQGHIPKDVTVLTKPIPFNDLRQIIENYLLK